MPTQSIIATLMLNKIRIALLCGLIVYFIAINFNICRKKSVLSNYMWNYAALKYKDLGSISWKPNDKICTSKCQNIYGFHCSISWKPQCRNFHNIMAKNDDIFKVQFHNMNLALKRVWWIYRRFLPIPPKYIKSFSWAIPNS